MFSALIVTYHSDYQGEHVQSYCKMDGSLCEIIITKETIYPNLTQPMELCMEAYIYFKKKIPYVRTIGP